MDGAPSPADAGYRSAGAGESARGNRRWWDAAADGYLAEHRDDLGDASFVWGPEGLDEADARLLGDVAGLDVLEVGAGAAQCSRWLRSRGARVVATDLSAGMLRTARRIDADRGDAPVPLVQADARALPFADAAFDAVVTAYGALPFVGDPERVHAEVARVLRPGGLWAFSLTHPVRWAFPDDPGATGLVVTRSYFDRTPYVETDDAGGVLYAEHHRTLGDRVRELVAAGFMLVDLVEPEWPRERRLVWGGWSPTRGAVIPGTAVFVARRR